MEILACIMEAVESNWITLNIEKELILWRWLLAAVFITEELEKNGTVDVPNDTGGVDTAVIYSSKHGAISVYPGPERFALANHIELGVNLVPYACSRPAGGEVMDWPTAFSIVGCAFAIAWLFRS